MEDDDVFDEVNAWSRDDDEKDEHWDHHEEGRGDGVEYKTDRDDHDSDPLGAFEAVFLIERKILIGSKDVDADR